jgi:flagellin
MPSIINTNITSMIAQNNLDKTGSSLQATIQRLSSGLRVNTASDDASGFAIANRMDAQIRGMAVATRNSNDAISFSQTASGALSQISNNLQRMRELAVQAANGSNSASDTSLLNQEFNQLQTEVSRIQGSTTFNNVNVFSATATVFQIGANTTSNDRVNVQGTALTASMSIGTQTITDRTTATAGADILTALTAASAFATSISDTTAKVSYLQNAAIDAINSNQKISFSTKSNMLTNLNAAVVANPNTIATVFTNLTTATTTGITGTGTVGGAVTAADNTSLVAAQTANTGQNLALAAINSLDTALTEVNTASAVQGALQNRFSAVISNLNAFSLSQTSAKSRIVDADFAAETAKLSKNQILQQAGTAMLAQANQLPSSVLSLLK